MKSQAAFAYVVVKRKTTYNLIKFLHFNYVPGRSAGGSRGGRGRALAAARSAGCNWAQPPRLFRGSCGPATHTSAQTRRAVSYAP